jgi:hypothetical protein
MVGRLARSVEHLQVRCKAPMAYASASRYRPTGPLRDDPAGRLDRPRLPCAGRVGHLSAPGRMQRQSVRGAPDPSSIGGRLLSFDRVHGP